MRDGERQPAARLEHGPATLRKWRPDDGKNLYTVVISTQGHLIPWMPWARGYTRRSAAEYLIAAENDWDSGAAFNYAITVDDAIVGCAGLMNRCGPGGLEVGYWVHRDWTRRGLATASTAALAQAAFGLPGIEFVELIHDELNLASAGVPRKLGFTEIGRRPMEIAPEAGSGTAVVWRLFRSGPAA